MKYSQAGPKSGPKTKPFVEQDFGYVEGNGGIDPFEIIGGGTVFIEGWGGVI